jgi:hypothetical protein
MSFQNKNMRAEYLEEQKQNKKMLDYYTLPYYGMNESKYYFSLGSVPKASREQLSGNSVDTESYLRNINATNLHTPNMKFVANDNSSSLKDGLFWDNRPTVMPLPMVIYENQRPLPN